METIDRGPVAIPHRWLFALAFALLISHELDAMIRQEWLLFPGFGDLSTETAADLFNLLHVPLFAALVFGLTSERPIVRQRVVVVVEVFVVAHALAHTAFRDDVDYRFEYPVETITVYGAAAVGIAHLLLWRPGAGVWSPAGPITDHSS